MKAVDETNNYIYFTASPNNATQLYLYRVRINNGKDEPELVSNAKLRGTHEYDMSPNGRIAFHSFSNNNTPSVGEWINLPENKSMASAK
jgi:dipeptidyl-peptidase 4